MRRNDRTRDSRRTTHLCRLLSLLAIAGAGLAGGCTPWATYPPIEGSAGIHDPSMSPIPDAIAQALRFAQFEDGRDGEIVFNLPAGTPPVVYQQVINRLAGGGRPMRDEGERAYHVTQVRVRTVEAEVDIIRRDAGGVPREMTVTVDRNLLSGFFVKDVRYWRYNVEEPPPHFMSATAETPDREPSGDVTPRTDATPDAPYDQ